MKKALKNKQISATSKVVRNHASDLSPRERIINTARRLFGEKGFHTTTTAELATEASVSTGQIYRHFDAKSDIVLAIVEQSVHERVAQMNTIFDSVERDECTIFDALKAIIEISLIPDNISLSYEITAEASRNTLVAERLETLINFYQEGVRRLAMLARPDIPADDLSAYADIMMACFVGLGLCTAIKTPAEIEQISSRTAFLMLRALGLVDNQNTT
ncbi:MAG: TetR/AcrR family transcriptional regulator [Spongiibacteraceae bacterium]